MLPTVEAFRVHLAYRLPTAKAFNLPRHIRTLSKVLKQDVEQAGLAWQEPGTMLFADFHSLRHTFITNLARSGVHPNVAQDLACHSHINLTMSRYSHTLLERRAEASPRMPEIVDEGAEAKDGTTGKSVLASCLASEGGKPRT